MFAAATPVVAAVQGAAVGGGLGLALSADFRVARDSLLGELRPRLGFHHRFGMTVTLPAIVGQQTAIELLLTGRQVGGEMARSLGLCDGWCPPRRSAPRRARSRRRSRPARRSRCDGSARRCEATSCAAFGPQPTGKPLSKNA